MNVVDLFSGAGGLTFGLYYKKWGNRFVRNKDFNFLFANECDPNASKAFRNNFPDIKLLERDIATINTTITDALCGNVETDLVIGGPPCQSYSLVGKRQYDKRAEMYQEYRRMLSLLRPKMFLFENVVGLLSMSNKNGQPVLDDIKAMFSYIDDTTGYHIHMKVLNAKDFAVPQSRERVFLVGIRKDTNITWNFPKPTIKRGNYLTICDAISDLPHLNMGEEVNSYATNPQNEYQSLMRGKCNTVTEHINGCYGEKMQVIMANVPQGESKTYINHLVEIGHLPEEYKITSGYNNTYGRLWWNRPSTTITNNLGRPSSLRCIHPLDDRALTTREGARLQSFPDFCKFYGNKYQKNSQVGNAVPPLLALNLAKEISKSII